MPDNVNHFSVPLRSGNAAPAGPAREAKGRREPASHGFQYPHFEDHDCIQGGASWLRHVLHLPSSGQAALGRDGWLLRLQVNAGVGRMSASWTSLSAGRQRVILRVRNGLSLPAPVRPPERHPQPSEGSGGLWGTPRGTNSTAFSHDYRYQSWSSCLSLNFPQEGEIRLIRQHFHARNVRHMFSGQTSGEGRKISRHFPETDTQKPTRMKENILERDD